MPQFILHIKDGIETEVAIEVDNAHEAVNAGYNALAIFVSRNFPPPDNVRIAVTDHSRSPIAVMRFVFDVQYAPGFLT